jgi:hypothetical protein
MKAQGKLVGRWREKRKGERGINKNNRGVNMIKVNYMLIWKCHDETPYHVKFNIHQ